VQAPTLQVSMCQASGCIFIRIASGFSMPTGLRIVASCCCLALSFSFALLWPLSYGTMERLGLTVPTRCTGLYSVCGRLEYEHSPNMIKKRTGIQLVSCPISAWGTALPYHRFGFAWERLYDQNHQGRPTYVHVSIPHWFMVLTTGVLAYIAKPKPRGRFGLRELFILSTTVALTAGAIAMLPQIRIPD
jgi:hypothetical protein